MAGAVLAAAHLNETRDNLNVLSTALLLPEHQASYWYKSNLGITPTNALVGADILWGMPITVPNSGTYVGISLDVSSAAGNVHFGIYDDDGGVPGALVVDAGEATVASPSMSSVIDEELAGPARYWIAALFDDAPTVSKLFEGTIQDRIGVTKTSVTYGALPDPFGAITGWQTSGPNLLIKRE
ncbi:MAG TPA: hypothetical protein VFS30_00555 [Dehalococcoidia bacterium]|nr:hypothetical protein [Dehalococcoidia bacterium]